MFTWSSARNPVKGLAGVNVYVLAKGLGEDEMMMTEVKDMLEVGGKTRVELVDNWHKAWPMVRDWIGRSGLGGTLRLDADGWLSARQSCLAAFVGEEPAGHLCFHVRPAQTREGRVIMEEGRAVLEARVDAVAVDPSFQEKGIERLLLDRARQVAMELRCRRLVEE